MFVLLEIWQSIYFNFTVKKRTIKISTALYK